MNFPAIRESVQKFFDISSCIDYEFNFYPVDLDIKPTEILRTLFVDGRRAKIVGIPFQGAIPVFLAGNNTTEETFCKNLPPVSIFLDLHDTGYDFVAMSLNMWQKIFENKLCVIYLKLQIHNCDSYYALNLLPSHVHIISCPLLLGGSRYHITTQVDLEGDRLFRKIYTSNRNPIYRHNWSWIGAPTSKDRLNIFEKLEDYKAGNCVFTVSQPGHADANAATIAYSEYIEICRSSKICLSLNGNGPWCLKDGELFSYDCFILRQYHPVLSSNPLSPQNGTDWVVFHNDEVIETIDYYLNQKEERERIRQKGHELFYKVLFKGYWANYYIDMLSNFLPHQNKCCWGKFLIS